MEYAFTCFGHENVTSKHKTTLEFIKDSELSLRGDCIIGIKADFSLLELKKFIKSLKNNKKVTITIQTIEKNKNIEIINAEINPSFNNEKEMVIRKSDFISDRTFAINADKAACDLDKELIKAINDNKQKIRVMLN